MPSASWRASSWPEGTRLSLPNQQMAAYRALGPCAVGALSACGLAPKPDPPSFRPGRLFLRSAAPPSASVSRGTLARYASSANARPLARTSLKEGGRLTPTRGGGRNSPLTPFRPPPNERRAAPRWRGLARPLFRPGHRHIEPANHRHCLANKPARLSQVQELTQLCCPCPTLFAVCYTRN